MILDNSAGYKRIQESVGVSLRLPESNLRTGRSQVMWNCFAYKHITRETGRLLPYCNGGVTVDVSTTTGGGCDCYFFPHTIQDNRNKFFQMLFISTILF